jgi:very-short-patch-repair endonuclease
MALEPHHRPVGALLRGNARRMRRRPTDAEDAMWRLWRSRRFEGLKFRRQVPFKNFILDFVCFELRLVVEIDGSQHFDAAGDRRRQRVLQNEGFDIVRYWNNDLLQRPRLVLEDLFYRICRLKSLDPSLGAARCAAPPSPTRGEGEAALTLRGPEENVRSVG